MDNARDRGIEFKTELNRVIIHGVLHLIGFNDKSAEDKELMRKEEDNCLILHSEMQ
jgi:rRNA maturation RNase YbeY